MIKLTTLPGSREVDFEIDEFGMIEVKVDGRTACYVGREDFYSTLLTVMRSMDSKVARLEIKGAVEIDDKAEQERDSSPPPGV